MWSPLTSEGGKTNPYKMNLESEPQVRAGHFVCLIFLFFCLGFLGAELRKEEPTYV